MRVLTISCVRHRVATWSISTTYCCSIPPPVSWSRSILISDAKSLLENTGLPINLKKSLLSPNFSLEYYGWVLDFINHEIRLPPRKQQELRDVIGGFVSDGSCSFEDWRSFLGLFTAFRTREEDEEVKDYFESLKRSSGPN